MSGKKSIVAGILAFSFIASGCGPNLSGIKSQYAQIESVDSQDSLDFKGYYVIVNSEEVEKKSFKYMVKYGAPLSLPLTDEGAMRDFPKVATDSGNYTKAKELFSEIKLASSEFIDSAQKEISASYTSELSVSPEIKTRVTSFSNELPDQLEVVYYDVSSDEEKKRNKDQKYIKPSLIAALANEKISEDSKIQSMFIKYKQFAQAYNDDLFIQNLKASGYMFTEFDNEDTILVIDDDKLESKNTAETGLVFYVITEASGKQSIFLSKLDSTQDRMTVGEVFKASSKLNTDLKVNGIFEIFQILKGMF
jgi:hypothetical protein